MILEGLLLLGALFAVCALWELVREHVRDWLHDLGLERSAFMDAFVVFERLMNGLVRATYHGRVKRMLFGSKPVTERVDVLEPHQVDDADVKRQLDAGHAVSREVLTLMD